MHAYAQPSLPLPRSPRARQRSSRRPFTPAPDAGKYRLPHDVRDRLAFALAVYRNREAAFSLAVFLARYWSVPHRIGVPFAIDRRSLTNHAALGLTEARVRGAIKALEEIGFLNRFDLSSGSKYRPTADGLHRKPIGFQFGPDYAPAFLSANKRAAAACERRSREHKPTPSAPTSRQPSTALLEARQLKSPKSMNVVVPQVYSGEIRKECGLPPKASEVNPQLEAALDRLWQGFRHSRDG